MAQTKQPATDPAKRPNEPAAIVSFWLNEIAAAKKRDKQFRKDGQDILDIYDSCKEEKTPFNILFSNTETMFPALYSATPRPVVQRRFKDDDPIGKAAATAGQRMLEFLVDTNVEGYDTFDDAMQCTNLDGLLPGRAFAIAKYDADFGEFPTSGASEEPSTGQAALPSAPAPGQEPVPYAKSELICVETKSWNRVYHGYAKKWSKVPWVAYEDQIDKQEATRLFSKAVVDKLVFTEEDSDREKDDADRPSQETRDKGERKTCTVYQIWDKDGSEKEPPKQVKYISPQYADGYLKVEDDPLQLTGFFNCPKPLMYVKKSNDLRPTALYNTYSRQAKELNRLTQRILRVVEAIKAKGIYDGQLGGDLKNLLQADENELVPSDTSGTLAAEKGIENAIWMWPVEKLIVVLRELYVAREQCKQVIYEITGISDIVRGASKASETLGAQEIKQQWGTMRLKRLQKEMQRFVRDMLRMMLELAATKFNEETWAKMTGLPFVTTMQRQQLQQIAMASQQSGMPLDPQTQQQLAAPVWGQVLDILRNDMQRAYRIDIETNSTIEPEAAEDQKQIADLMTALGQYLNGVGPLVQKGVMPFGVAQSMLLAITRRFRFGTEIEEFIKQMQPPKPEDDGKAGEMMKQQAMTEQMKTQGMAKISQLETQLKAVEAEKALFEAETQLKLREIALKAKEDACAMQEQMMAEKMTMRDQTFQTKVSATDKVRSIKEASTKRDEQVAKTADNKLATGVQALQSTVEQMAKMQTDLIQVVAQQSDLQAQRIEQVIHAVTAPRIKKAVRDKSGKLDRVEETVA